MQAITVKRGRSNTLAIINVPDPVPAHDELLVEGIALGVCGARARPSH
jgi:NADPH:quinone reductase-like Zn-dependent oxidoreductase